MLVQTISTMKAQIYWALVNAKVHVIVMAPESVILMVNVMIVIFIQIRCHQFIPLIYVMALVMKIVLDVEVHLLVIALVALQAIFWIMGFVSHAINLVNHV